MSNLVKVGMADLNVCKSPGGLTTLGLGSCVGVVLYDKVKKIGGLAHVMLPDSTKIKNNQNIAKFADTAIDQLVKDMIALGADRKRMIAKLAGGAQMFSFSSASDLMRIGLKNAEASHKKLKELGISVVAEDTGKNYGRTIEFYPESGELHIKTIGKELKII